MTTDTDALIARVREALERDAANLRGASKPHERGSGLALAALDGLARIVQAATALYDDAGVDDIDQRLDYLMLQVSREAWNDFVAAVKP